LRKWTLSACVVLAWCIILPVLMGAGSSGSSGPGRPAQANILVANSAQVTATRTPATSVAVTRTPRAVRETTARTVATWVVQPGDTLSAIAAALHVPGGWQALYAANRSRVGPDPNLIQPGTVLVVPGREESARYTVAPGDTLTSIATGLGVAGGWQALYAANRRVIGPDPDLIHAGTVLVVPHPAVRRAARRPAPSQGHPRHRAAAHASARSRNPSANLVITTAGMPRWLEDLLLVVGVLAAIALLADPLLGIGRRYYRRRTARRALSLPSPPLASSTGRDPRESDPTERERDPRVAARLAAEQARIILADHERLIVTYSVRDDAVYVLTPPDEDPQAVLRAARLVLPDQKYEELAAHLGVRPDWPLE
jgi:LysM repeat protein